MPRQSAICDMQMSDIYFSRLKTRKNLRLLCLPSECQITHLSQTTLSYLAAASPVCASGLMSLSVRGHLEADRNGNKPQPCFASNSFISIDRIFLNPILGNVYEEFGATMAYGMRSHTGELGKNQVINNNFVHPVSK